MVHHIIIIVVGTAVYNTSGSEICAPAVQVFFFITPPPSAPSCIMVPSLYKARMDKTSDCGNHNLFSGGTSGAHTTNTGDTVSAPASTWPGFRSLFCTGP